MRKYIWLDDIISYSAQDLAVNQECIVVCLEQQNQYPKAHPQYWIYQGKIDALELIVRDQKKQLAYFKDQL